MKSIIFLRVLLFCSFGTLVPSRAADLADSLSTLKAKLTELSQSLMDKKKIKSDSKKTITSFVQKKKEEEKKKKEAERLRQEEEEKKRLELEKKKKKEEEKKKTKELTEEEKELLERIKKERLEKEKLKQKKLEKEQMSSGGNLSGKIAQLENIGLNAAGKMWKYQTFKAKLVVDKTKISVDEALDILTEGSKSEDSTTQENALMALTNLVEAYGGKDANILARAYDVAHSEPIKDSKNAYLQDLRTELIKLLDEKNYKP